MSPSKIKKGDKSNKTFASTKLSERYRYSVKCMKKVEVDSNDAIFKKDFNFLIKYTYSFPKVLWWRAVYSISLLFLFSFSHTLSNLFSLPRNFLESSFMVLQSWSWGLCAPVGFPSNLIIEFYNKSTRGT